MKIAHLDGSLTELLRSKVGGKAYQINQIAGYHKVPAAFCLTIDATNILMSIEGREKKENIANKLIYDTYYSMEFDQFASAVRSSATQEDGAYASFSGLFSSYLNVVGIQEISSRIIDCIESLQKPHVMQYAKHLGIAGNINQMAVIVQKHIKADSSLVAYSVDINKGNNQHLVIHASWGLCEGIVNGTVNTDRIVCDKTTGTIVSYEIQEKLKKVAEADRSTQLVSIPREQATQSTLSQSQIREVIDTVTNLEKRCGFPVDVELSYEKGLLYVLQCRPIPGYLRKQ